MNTKQQAWLKQWLSENEFEGKKEPEWTPPRVIHSSDIVFIYKKLKELEETNTPSSVN